jgi:pimeloyl-ACP methyl ester carboxylesterase
MWAPLAIVLAKDHTVIVPDLRGMGISDHPDTGYTKKNQAVDIAGVMDALKVQKADLVTHDIGNMVGYASAAQYPIKVDALPALHQTLLVRTPEIEVPQLRAASDVVPIAYSRQRCIDHHPARDPDR